MILRKYVLFVIIIMPLNYHIKKKTPSKKIKRRQRSQREETEEKKDEETFYLMQNCKTQQAKSILQNYSSVLGNEDNCVSATETLKQRKPISEWCQNEELDEELKEQKQVKVFKRNTIKQKYLSPLKYQQVREQSQNQQKIENAPNTQIFVIDSNNDDSINERFQAVYLNKTRKSSVKSANNSLKNVQKLQRFSQIKRERKCFKSKVVSFKPQELNYNQKNQPLHSSNSLIQLKDKPILKSSTIKIMNSNYLKVDFSQNKRYMDFNTLMKKYKQRHQRKEIEKGEEEGKKKYSPNGYIINNYMKKKNHNKIKAMQLNIKQKTEASTQKLNMQYTNMIRTHLLKERLKTTVQIRK